jgi:3-oxoadipate enol-lactonase/4-carboxymuconolactone decarboxylase
MPQVTNQDVAISFSDQGEGAPTLLLHGHTFDRRVWDPVMPALIHADLRVIRPDLRGHGRSDRPDSGYHVSHHAADVLAVLDSSAVERATVVGFSFGGGVALELALSHPDRVASVGLLATTMPDRAWEPEFMDNLRRVAQVVRNDGVKAAMLGPWMESPLFAFSFSKEGISDSTRPIVEDFPGAEFLATERDRVERGWTLPERLGEISAPTRVMVGEHEMAGFLAYSNEAAEKIPGATLEIVPDCGHLLPLEAPAAVAEMIVGLVGDR